MKPTEADIQDEIKKILEEMTSTWDVDADEIGGETQVVADLGFSSIDIIHLMASLEMRFHRKLPYDEIIMKDGQYVEDISVGELTAFVSRNADNAARGPQAM